MKKDEREGTARRTWSVILAFVLSRSSSANFEEDSAMARCMTVLLSLLCLFGFVCSDDGECIIVIFNTAWAKKVETSGAASRRTGG